MTAGREDAPRRIVLVLALLTSMSAAAAGDVSRPAMLLAGATVCDRPQATAGSCRATVYEVPVQLMDEADGWYLTRALRPGNRAAEGWVRRATLRIGDLGDCITFAQTGVPDQACSRFQ